MQTDYLELATRFVDRDERTPALFARLCTPEGEEGLERRALELSMLSDTQRD